MPKSIPWTKQMDELLVSLNRRAQEVALEQIAQELGVSTVSVWRRIQTLAKSHVIPPQEAVRVRGRKKGKPTNPWKWTPEKLQELIDLFDGKRSDEEIGELMGESSTAIHGQVWILRKAGRLPKRRREYGRKPRSDQGVSRIFSLQQDRLLIKRVQEGKTQKSIAKKLDVTERQVRTRVRQLRQRGHLPPYDAGKRVERARRRRRLVIRMYSNGRSLKDIAKACGSTSGTINVMLVRLRKKGEITKRPQSREEKRARAPSNSATTGSSA